MASGRLAEEAFIVARKLRGTLVAHGIGGGIGIGAAIKEQLLGLIEPQALLVLQGSERREFPEMTMEGRGRHVRDFGEPFNRYVGTVVVPQPPDRLPDALPGGIRRIERSQAVAARARKRKAVNVADDEGRAKGNLRRLLEKREEPVEVLHELLGRGFDGENAFRLARRVVVLNEFGKRRRIERNRERDEGFFLRDVHELIRGRHVDRGHDRRPRAVAVFGGADHEALVSPENDADRQPVEAVLRLDGFLDVGEVKPLDRMKVEGAIQDDLANAVGEP